MPVLSGDSAGQLDAQQEDPRASQGYSTGQEAVRSPAGSTISELGPKMSEENQQKAEAKHRHQGRRLNVVSFLAKFS